MNDKHSPDGILLEVIFNTINLFLYYTHLRVSACTELYHVKKIRSQNAVFIAHTLFGQAP